MQVWKWNSVYHRKWSLWVPYVVLIYINIYLPLF